MSRYKIAIAFVVIIAVVMRLCYLSGLPLGGDEVGVGMHQAAGQSLSYKKDVHENEIISVDTLKNTINYSSDHGPGDVLKSLKYAGMHPPFYYIILHYVFRFAGNGAATLRLISVVFSSISVVLMYRLGKMLAGRGAGLLASLLLAVSSWGVMYGGMVRPYPLAMMLALLSTVVLLKLEKKSEKRVLNKYLFFYIAVSVIGLYTIYHYAFVVFFQLVYMFLAGVQDKKKPMRSFVAALAIGLLYLPWLPALKHQMGVTTNNSFYFHNNADILTTAKTIVAVNFARFLPIVHTGIIEKAILFSISGLILFGSIKLLKGRSKRLFVISFAAYGLFYYAVEKALGMNTFMALKIQFFMIPVLLILLCIGICSLNKTYVKVVFALAVLILTIANTVLMYKVRPEPQEAAMFLTVNETVNENMQQGQNALFITNTRLRRYVLPLAHMFENPMDMMIVTKPVLEVLPAMSDLEKYDHVYVKNFMMPSRVDFWSDDEIMQITERLKESGLMLSSRSDPFGKYERVVMYVYSRKTMP